MRYLIKTSTTLREEGRNCANGCVLEDGRFPCSGHSSGQNPPDCPATPTPPLWFNKGQIIKTWALLRYPRAGCREFPTLQSPSPSQTKAAPSQPRLSRELRGTSHLSIHWRKFSEPLWVTHASITSHPVPQNPVSKTCLENICIYIYYNFFLLIIKHLVLGH